MTHWNEGARVVFRKTGVHGMIEEVLNDGWYKFKPWNGSSFTVNSQELDAITDEAMLDDIGTEPYGGQFWIATRGGA